MNAGDTSQPQIAFMKAVARATANKSLHTPDLGGKQRQSRLRRSLRDTTERERLGQIETATVLLTNAPSTTAIAQADDLAG
jgi:hypothetical protein